VTELRKPSKQSCPVCGRRVSALPAPRGRWQLVTHRPLSAADRKRFIACKGSGGLVGALAPRTEPAQEPLFSTPPPSPRGTREERYRAWLRASQRDE